MYDTLDSSPFEKVKLFWQRFQHKLFVYFLNMYHIECFWDIAYLKQTWEELQLYLSMQGSFDTKTSNLFF